MHHSRIPATLLLAAIFGTIASIGCHRKVPAAGAEVAEAPPPTARPSNPPVTTGPAQPKSEPSTTVDPRAPVFPPSDSVSGKSGDPPQTPTLKDSTPDAQPPAPMSGPKAKEPPAQAPTPSWPKQIAGKDAAAYVRDATDPDSTIRKLALETLPWFGPDTRELKDKDGKHVVAKAVVARMDPTMEWDPGVRVAAYCTAAYFAVCNPPVLDEVDARDAIRLLGRAVDDEVNGPTRLYAVRTMALFGPMAGSQVNALVAAAGTDTSFETRRAIATTLGRIAFDERTGPSVKALNCLTGVLINDSSVVVRLEAMQVLVRLGGPWEPRPFGAKAKDFPRPDVKAIAGHVAAIKNRLAPAPFESGEKAGVALVERDKQVEIWARLALIRFDAKELTDENLTGIARHLAGGELGPKLHALHVLAQLGEAASKKLDDVISLLNDEIPNVVAAAVATLVAMGPAAKAAIPDLEKVKTRPIKYDDKEREKAEKEFYKKVAEDGIKAILDAKPAALPPPPTKTMSQDREPGGGTMPV